VSLVCVDEVRLLGDIERVLGHTIPSEDVEGFEPDPRIRPEPILRGGLGGARPGGSRPIHVPRHLAGQRPNGAPRPTGDGARGGASRRSGHGRGFAGPNRPGQSIGNAGPARPGYGPRHDQRQPGRPVGRQSGPDRTRGTHRPAGPGIILPGERLARGGRPQG
jgi:ATP-dependent RNA helicase RhlE